jgi:hypothetical protein
VVQLVERGGLEFVLKWRLAKECIEADIRYPIARN